MFDYEPVLRVSAGPYSGAAMTGTHSAIIGWSFENQALRDGLLGFGIRRTTFDKATGDTLDLRWLGGYKRFEETDDGQSGEVGSLTAPFQRFRWNDYTLRPERAYRYEVFPMRGTPAALTQDEDPLVFEFSPSDEDSDGLGIYVNRGVTAAKAYFERFGDVHPKDTPNEGAYRWLSRGLKESLLEFIDGTPGGTELHVAIYEFHDEEIAHALVEAQGRGVTVAIVYDFQDGKRSTTESEHILNHSGLMAVATKRTTVNISHNKLVIRVEGGVATAAWTGSANFSENAFHYQTNTGLVIRDAELVGHFETYFQNLTGNPTKAKSKDHNQALMAVANAPGTHFAEKTFFSPIRPLDILETSVDLIENAEQAVMVSAPFGVDQMMIDALDANPQAMIEYGLVNATAIARIAGLDRHNTRFFPPKKLKTYRDERWDAKAFGAHKIHAKTIVVDPYSDNPKVLIGSANFSKASCKDNDENALLISGNKRLAAIITTEFMRMYDHYKARFFIEKLRDAGVPQNIHLKSDESWSATSFDATSFSHKFRDREVFSGKV